MQPSIQPYRKFSIEFKIFRNVKVRHLFADEILNKKIILTKI